MAGGTHRHTGAAGSGVLFEVIFNNANPRKKPGHGISLSYGGQVYRCNDAEPIRSVHTFHTDDEGEAADLRSPGKKCSQKPPREPPRESTCLKKSPRRLSRQSTPLLRPSPKKLKRSRTLSPSHQSRARSILAPFSNLSRKFVRRHSYDEGVKTKREKSPVRRETRPEQRPTVQGIPPGFAYAPQPTPLVYQNQIPMYRYIPAQPQTVFGAAPMAYPMAQAPPSAAPQCPPELHHLQARINHATCSLAANPIDLHAKQELNRLLAERNSFLDSATKRPAPPSAVQPAVALKPEADKSRSIIDKSLIVDKRSNKLLQNEHKVSEVSNESVTSEKQHVCSGCGAARSPSFHRKHPFAKPVHNVCRKCRVGKRHPPSVIKRYHFCSSCGIVRSKEYHRRRGNAASVSLRSQICRKCHGSGDSIRDVLLQSKRPSQEEKLAKPYPKPSASIRVERTRSVPLEQSVSADDNQSFGYDGASSFASSVQPEKYKTESSSSTKADFHSYRSPEVSDESISDRGPSVESSLRSSGTSSRVYKEELREESSIDNAPIPASEREWNQESFHLPEQASNPYYLPRNATTRLSSPFQYTDASHRSRNLERPVSEVYSQPSDHDTRPDSPRLQDAQNPPFVARNQSWPGDLNLHSSPGAFSSFSNFNRKVSASDGAQTPQNSPIADTHRQNEAAGARFTKGAFGKPASSFKSSPPQSPWASFSGPIPKPGSDSGSKGAFYDAASSSASARWQKPTSESVFGSYNDGAASEPEPGSPGNAAGVPFRFGRRPKSFSSRHGVSTGAAEFASTRGAWNINTSCHEAAHPEPIIEEPSSPVRESPLTTPLLLEFSLGEDMSDSGVEFLTDSSSSPSSSSDDESIAANIETLAIHD